MHYSLSPLAGVVAFKGKIVHNANAMGLPYCRSAGYYTDLFETSRPALEDILRRYEIPSQHAGRILEEVMLELIYRGERPQDPHRRLTNALTRKCRSYWVVRRRQLKASVERVFTHAWTASGGPAKGA